MPARGTHEPARRIGLQPPLVLTPIPDAVFGPEHPAPAFAVEHREVAHSDAKRPRLQISDPAFLDEKRVADLRFGERIDSHPQSMPSAKG